MKKIINNDKRWYLVRMTQEGALKWTSILNQKYPNGSMAIVTTRDTERTDDIRIREVIFHIYTTPADTQVLKTLLGDYITRIKSLEEPGYVWKDSKGELKYSEKKPLWWRLEELAKVVK